MSSDEIWKPIHGYEGYYDVSNKGRVRSYWHGTQKNRYTTDEPKILQGCSAGAYKTVCLIKPGCKKENTYIHRHVAEAFLENPANKLFINHKDGDKQNNDVTNLEWCTHNENMAHAYENGLNGKCRKVRNVKTGEEFRSICEAARCAGRSFGWVYNRVSGKLKNEKERTYEFVRN